MQVVTLLNQVNYFPLTITSSETTTHTHGGGVFILVHKNLVTLEEPQFVTDCEIVWVKVKIKGNKDLFVGCFYMPHRNLNNLNELQKSLKNINTRENRHIILCGDFNCPDINWETLQVPPCSSQRNVQQKLTEISIINNLTQIHHDTTRYTNTIDVIFTTNPSLIKSSVSVPGISDHHAILVDSLIRPIITNTKKRKVYAFAKENWNNLNDRCI